MGCVELRLFTFLLAVVYYVLCTISYFSCSCVLIIEKPGDIGVSGYLTNNNTTLGFD